MTAPRRWGGRLMWTAQEDACLRRWYPHQPTAALATIFERSTSAVYARARILGLKKSDAYLASPAACRLRRGDNVGAATRFKKGLVPANKGVRRPGYGPGRMKETQFKKGQLSGRAAEVRKPIGHERLGKDGYLERKVNDALPFKQRWRAVHLLLWESVHGPLPPKHAVTFINGDKTDIRLENLRLVHRRALMARNTVHNYPKPLAQSIQLLGALRRKIRNRTKGHAEKQDRRSA